jgi:urease gamma subunit
MLANAGIMMDYDGFKTVFDTNPQLKNVIAQFNKDEITFVGDSDDEGAGYEEPQGDMPDDERVAKMAQRATKMRTREFVEGELPPHLSKMFGKDGTQVETRTDVMKQMRDIVDKKSAMEVTFGDGKQMVDMYTASVLLGVYDKVNPANQEKIVQRVGTYEKFSRLMPKLYGMLGSRASYEVDEGDSPHPKGSKKYKAHMAAKHANMNEGKSMEDKIAADIEAGMSTDAIIGKYANKRTTNTDEIRKIIQKIKFKMFKNNESPTKKLSLSGPMNMEPLDLSKLDPNRITVRSMRKK